MFIRTSSSTRNGKTYTTAQIVEGYRTADGKVRQKILFNLGSVEKLLKRDIDNLINGFLRIKGQTPPNESDVILSSKHFGHIWAAMMLFKELQITKTLRQAAQQTKTEFDLVKHIQLMVLNRLDDPQSKLGLLNWCEDVYLPSIDSKNIKYPHLLRAMDFLIKHKRQIEDEIAARFLTIFDTELKLCFYDLTSSYFQSEHEVESDIRKRGYSRDHRSDCKQVVIGVVMNQDGIPLCHYTFDGNTSDRQTVIEVVDDIKSRFGVKEVTLVADKGMTSKANYGWLQETSVGFILGESKRIRNTVREGLVKAETKRHAGRPAGRQEKHEEPFYHEESGYVNIRSSKGSDVKLPVRHIYCYNPETAKKQQIRRERSIDGLLALASQLEISNRTSEECYHQLKDYVQKHHIARLVKIPEDIYSEKVKLCQKEIEFESQADGWFVVSTDKKTEAGFTSEKVIAQYKRLQMVENGFKTLKSTLDIRPMFHWTPERIKAHVFICFIALQLTVFFNLRLRNTKHNFEKAFSKLRRIDVVTWKSGHSHHHALVSADVKQLEIFEALKVPRPSMKSLVVSDF